MKLHNRASQAFTLGAVVALAAACGGIPVNINGKTTYIGGSKNKSKSESGKQNTAPATGQPGAALSETSSAITRKASASLAIPEQNLEPMYEVAVKVEGTVLRLSEHGFKECGDAWGVGKPMARLVVKNEQVLTVKFKENTPRSEPRYQGIMMMMPGDSYICKGYTSEGITKRFPAGEYYVYSAWSAVKVNNHKHPGEAFASTGTLEVRTMGRKEPAPVFTLDSSVPNPWYSDEFVYSGAYNTAKAMGYKKCSSYYPITAGHVAEIQVKEAVETVFEIQGAKSVIVTDEQERYWCDVRLSQPRKWEPGRYKIFSVVDNETAKTMAVKTFKVRHYNTNAAPTMLGEVPTYTIDELSQPRVIQGKSLGNRYTHARECGGKEQYFSTQPDFYLELEQPRDRLNIRLLDRKANQAGFAVVDVTKNKQLLYRRERRCSGGGHITGGEMTGYKVRNADGIYAVYIAHPGPPMDYTFILNTEKTHIDPFFKTKTIPGDLDVEGRVMRRHYPLMDRMSIGRDQGTRILTWEKIDPNLIAYTRKPAEIEQPKERSRRGYLGKTGALNIAAGEPVVILGVEERRKSGKPFKLTVMTVDLHVVVIDADAVWTIRPDALSMPGQPRNYEMFQSSIMIPHVDKRAAAALATFEKANAKYNACFDKYWDKHGGSEASHYDRVTRRNGKIVKIKNMGKIIGQRGRKKCGAARIDKLQAKRDQELWRSFSAKRRAVLAAIAARLRR